MDRLRVITFSPGGRPIVQRDLNDGTTFSLVRDTLALTAPQRQQQWSQAIQRYQGSLLARESHENGTLAAEWYVSGGGSADVAKDNMELLMREFESVTEDRYIEWRQENSTRSTYFPIRGPGQWEFMYRWIEFQAVKTLHVKGGWSIAPLAEGDRLEINDPFNVDSSSDYTSWTGGLLAYSAGNGLALVNGNRHNYHSARGYKYGDMQVSVAFQTGATVSSLNDSVSATMAVDSGSYLEARFNNATLELREVVAGTPFSLSSTAVTAVQPNSRYTVVIRKEGNQVFAELWSSGQPNPRPMFAPPNSTSTTLAGTDATTFGQGAQLYPGHKTIATTPAGWYLTRFAVEPYVYRNRTLPEHIRMDGPIPGDAPAATTATITHLGGAANPIWGMLAWTPRPVSSPNYVQVGDFELPLNAQWSVAGLTAMNAAATSFNRVGTSAAKYGSTVGRVVTPGTQSQEGANLPIYRTFKKGVSYTATAWVNVNSGTATMQLRLGDPGNADTATSPAVTANTGIMQQMSVTWTPTADRTVAYISPQTGATVATTFNFDGVTVYETALGAPAGFANTEGRGGVPPFGIFEAENYLVATGFAAAPVSNAIYLSGRGLEVANMTTTTSAVIDHYVDPSLLVPDEMYRGDVEIEVWARMNIPSTAVSLLITACTGTVTGIQAGGTRYTREYGQAGKTLTTQVPNSGSATRLIRLGTLTMNTLNSVPWAIENRFSWSSASSGVLGLDYIMLVPVRSRAASATGKTSAAGYGNFIADYTVETSKIIYPNLRAAAYAPQYQTPPFPDIGIGGAPIWLRPGNNDVMVKLSSQIPDDTVANGTSEQVTHTATVKMSPVPRYFISRGS